MFRPEAGFTQTAVQSYNGWPLGGYPLIIHKQKKLALFPTIERAKAFDKETGGARLGEAERERMVNAVGGVMIEAIPGDFVDISESSIQFIKPVSFIAKTDFSFNCRNDTKKIVIPKNTEYVMYYQDVYMLIVGNRRSFCLIDLLYNIRPVPFSLDNPPKTEWWVRIYEYKSFKTGWIKFDETNFFRNFNPRYLRNFNNRKGITADYEKTTVYKYDLEDTIVGLYWDASEFDAFKGEFKKHCLFIYTGTPDKTNPALYDITTLNINPKHIRKLQINAGKLRYGWRGETSTVVIQLRADPSGCDGTAGLSDEPKFHRETKKNFPLGFGVVIKKEEFLRAEDYQELTAKTRFRDYYAHKSRRVDRIITYQSPEQYRFDPSNDAFQNQTLKKWDAVFIYEIVAGWARVNVKRIKQFGWIPIENLVYFTAKKKFPPFETFGRFVSSSSQ